MLFSFAYVVWNIICCSQQDVLKTNQGSVSAATRRASPCPWEQRGRRHRATDPRVCSQRDSWHLGTGKCLHLSSKLFFKNKNKDLLCTGICNYSGLVCLTHQGTREWDYGEPELHFWFSSPEVSFINLSKPLKLELSALLQWVLYQENASRSEAVQSPADAGRLRHTGCLGQGERPPGRLLAHLGHFPTLLLYKKNFLSLNT